MEAGGETPMSSQDLYLYWRKFCVSHKFVCHRHWQHEQFGNTGCLSIHIHSIPLLNCIAPESMLLMAIGHLSYRGATISCFPACLANSSAHSLPAMPTWARRQNSQVLYPFPINFAKFWRIAKPRRWNVSRLPTKPWRSPVAQLGRRGHVATQYIYIFRCLIHCEQLDLENGAERFQSYKLFWFSAPFQQWVKVPLSCHSFIYLLTTLTCWLNVSLLSIPL